MAVVIRIIYSRLVKNLFSFIWGCLLYVCMYVCQIQKILQREWGKVTPKSKTTRKKGKFPWLTIYYLPTNLCIVVINCNLNAVIIVVIAVVGVAVVAAMTIVVLLFAFTVHHDASFFSISKVISAGMHRAFIVYDVLSFI